MSLAVLRCGAYFEPAGQQSSQSCFVQIRSKGHDRLKDEVFWSGNQGRPNGSPESSQAEQDLRPTDPGVVHTGALCSSSLALGTMHVDLVTSKPR